MNAALKYWLQQLPDVEAEALWIALDEGRNVEMIEVIAKSHPDVRKRLTQAGK